MDGARNERLKYETLSHESHGENTGSKMQGRFSSQVATAVYVRKLDKACIDSVVLTQTN